MNEIYELNSILCTKTSNGRAQRESQGTYTEPRNLDETQVLYDFH